MIDPGCSTELVADVEAVRPGDVVRRLGDTAWSVAIEHRASGPDGVRPLGPVGFQITVSFEAIRRAAHGEFPARELVIYMLPTGPRRRTAGPVERMLEPAAWLRLRSPSALIAAALALQAATEGERWQVEEELCKAAAVARADALGRGS